MANALSTCDKKLTNILVKAENDASQNYISYDFSTDKTNNLAYLLLTKKTRKYTYTQKYIKEYLMICMIYYKRFNNINFNIYKSHYMYLFLTDLQDPENQKRVIIKVGFTTDISIRIKDLKNTYKCAFYLIGLRRINGIFDEKAYHNFIRKNHPQLKCSIKILKCESDETYFLHPIIMETFVDYKIFVPNELEIEQEKTKQEQENTLQEKEKTKQQKYTTNLEIEQEKTKQCEFTTNLEIEQEKTKQEKIKLLELMINKNISIDFNAYISKMF